MPCLTLILRQPPKIQPLLQCLLAADFPRYLVKASLQQKASCLVDSTTQAQRLELPSIENAVTTTRRAQEACWFKQLSLHLASMASAYLRASAVHIWYTRMLAGNMSQDLTSLPRLWGLIAMVGQVKQRQQYLQHKHQ
jgi:hypothetical protein